MNTTVFFVMVRDAPEMVELLLLLSLSGEMRFAFCLPPIAKFL
jgi:hypothetical protein